MTDKNYLARLLLNPFDPNVNTPKDIGLGGPSTEYIVTDPSPSGGYWNYPSIWWDDSGNPQVLNGDLAYRMAMDYEQATGRRFPRYDTEGAAVFGAMNRSAMGGATKNRLAKFPWEK